MVQFYVPDERSVRRSLESQTHHLRIVIAGVDSSDTQVKLFVGVVRSVEDCGERAPPRRRWLITMHANS